MGKLVVIIRDAYDTRDGHRVCLIVDWRRTWTGAMKFRLLPCKPQEGDPNETSNWYHVYGNEDRVRWEVEMTEKPVELWQKELTSVSLARITASQVRG